MVHIHARAVVCLWAVGVDMRSTPSPRYSFTSSSYAFLIVLYQYLIASRSCFVVYICANRAARQRTFGARRPCIDTERAPLGRKVGGTYTLAHLECLGESPSPNEHVTQLTHCMLRLTKVQARPEDCVGTDLRTHACRRA